MALSQADFYAYSRATGAPVPRDPEEQAQMAPAVLDFRRNQLKAPTSNQQQGPDLGQVAGVGAALAGLTAGAYGLARILRQKPIAAAAKPPTIQEMETVARKATSQPIPTPQAAPPTASRPFSPRSYVEDTGSLEQRPTGQSSRIPTRASQPGSFSDLTAIQENLLNQTRDQLSNAVESGEDQMTGRVKQQLQRNEDYDLGQIDVLEDIAEYNRIQGMEQDEPISSVASSLPDGLPTDQAERLQGQSTSLPTRANQPGSFSDLTNIQNNLLEQARRSSFLKAKREQVQSKREQLLDVEHKIYDMVASAAEKGIKMEPNRALQIITNPTIELNQEELSLFQINPELGKFALKGQTFEPGQSQTGANLSILGERLKSVPNIGSDPQAFVKQAASGTSIRGRSRIQNEPDEFRQRVSSQGRPVEDDFVFVDEGGTVTVYPGEELTELALEETPSPRYQRFARDPFTQKMKEEYAPKGMRAVNTVEGRPYFVPATDPGGVGIYGIERSYASGPVVKVDLPAQGRVAGAYTKTALRSPTELPFTERYPKGGAGFSQMSSPQLRTFIENAPEGRVRQAGELEMSRRENSKQSLQVSEALRRANIEGRDPQVVLRDLGFNV